MLKRTQEIIGADRIDNAPNVRPTRMPKEAIKKERIEVFFLDFLVVIELFHNEISEIKDQEASTKSTI